MCAATTGTTADTVAAAVAPAILAIAFAATSAFSLAPSFAFALTDHCQLFLVPFVDLAGLIVFIGAVFFHRSD